MSDCPLQVSIAVGLAAFACVLLVVLFIMINKYGRRSKFGMKGTLSVVSLNSPEVLCRHREEIWGFLFPLSLYPYVFCLWVCKYVSVVGRANWFWIEES